MTKLEVARRQLGTALALFLEDLDPVSVHSLTCAACELLSHLAEKSGRRPFNSYILASYPDETAATLRRAQHAYWNAFKHALKPDFKTERDDADLLADFSDSRNDHDLFIGWYNYSNVTGQAPIEAQLFQFWYIAAHPEVGLHVPQLDAGDLIFPNLAQVDDRGEQKRRLRAAIVRHRPLVKDDPITEKLPLVLPREG
jgi:hypothetical protein